MRASDPYIHAHCFVPRVRPSSKCLVALMVLACCVPPLWAQAAENDDAVESVEPPGQQAIARPSLADLGVIAGGDQEGQSNSPQTAGTDSPQQDDSFTNGPNDWMHHWLREVDKVRSEQPHYVAPLITTHVDLVQQFRLDTQYQTSSSGIETSNYGAMHGLEIIPNTRMEIQVGIPPYMFHDSPTMKDGFGDVSIFLKFRIVSATEGKGGYFVGAFLGGSFPTGSPGNSMGHTVWSPMFAAAKRWSFFDWQTNLSGNLPQSGTATLGRQIVFNNTFQFSVADKLWPEVEDNATFFKQGPHAGNTENFLTPGLLIGPFRIAERLHFEPGGGIQISTTHFNTYNHRWMWTVRFPF
jgi:hypothetical protein